MTGFDFSRGGFFLFYSEHGRTKGRHTIAITRSCMLNLKQARNRFRDVLLVTVVVVVVVVEGDKSR